MLGVGNVGEELAPYKESDTFLTRNAGFTWEEVHKDAHMWEFGDSGSVLVIVNDEEPTDHVQFSINEGLTWREFNFGIKIRVTSLTTVPADNSRKFLLIGYEPRGIDKSVVVYLDFSALTKKQCRQFFHRFLLSLIALPQGKLNKNDPSHDDFELWSPSENREEQCLFGAQVSDACKKTKPTDINLDLLLSTAKGCKLLRWRSGKTRRKHPEELYLQPC